MSAITTAILNKVKIMAKISNTTIYDEEIEQFIETQYLMLEQTGIPKPTDESDTEYVSAYATAVAYYYLMSFDEGVNDEQLRNRYHEVLELLRVKVLNDS